MKQLRWLLRIVIVIAVIVRFWQLPELFHWTMDEEYWSYLPFNVATGYHIPLIGGHIGGTGLYSGPLFVWLMGIVFWLIGSQPIGVAAVISFIGILTTIGVYLVAKKLEGQYVAVLAGLVYASSTLITLYDRKYWNASLSSILSVTSIYILLRIKESYQRWLVVLLGGIVALAFHAHMTGIVVVLATIVAMYFLRLPKRVFLEFLVVFALLQTPLLVFELRHDFLNTRAFTKLLTSQNTESNLSSQPQVNAVLINTIARVIYTPATDIHNELTLCVEKSTHRSLPNIVVKVLAGLILIWILFQGIRGHIFGVVVGINSFLLYVYAAISPENFYVGQLAEYYLLPAFPFLAIGIAKGSWQLHKQFPLAIPTLVLFFVVINLHTTFNLTHSQGYSRKMALVTQVVQQLEGATFSLDVTGHDCSMYGYRYLFSYLGKEPSVSYMDPAFGWLYQERLPTGVAKQVVIDADSDTIKITDATNPTNQNP